MQDLLLCSLYLRADKPGQEKEDAVGGELLTFMLAFPTLKTWTNVQECAAERQLSYDGFSDFVAQAAFASPPSTVAGFTSGAPVSRRGPITAVYSDTYVASLWATQWHTRLDAVSPFASRVPQGTGAPVADAVAGVREDSDEYSDVAAVVKPVAGGDTGAQTPDSSPEKGTLPRGRTAVFLAEEEVPLTSAWGIDDCAATLAAAYGVLAVTLEERSGDGAAAMALYAGSKSALRHVRRWLATPLTWAHHAHAGCVPWLCCKWHALSDFVSSCFQHQSLIVHSRRGHRGSTHHGLYIASLNTFPTGTPVLSSLSCMSHPGRVPIAAGV